MPTHSHTISVLVENKFGVLSRVAGLFSGRGYNIHSLNVAPCEDPRFSRMTIDVNEASEKLDQVIKQLSKLKGLEAHTTVILSAVDVNVFRRLGINVTHEPKYQTYKLFHK